MPKSIKHDKSNIKIYVRERFGVGKQEAKVAFVDNETDLAIIVVKDDLDTVTPINWRRKDYWDIKLKKLMDSKIDKPFILTGDFNVVHEEIDIWNKEKKETGLLVTHFIENGVLHPNYPEYKVDVYRLSNEINWFTGKARINGDIWLKRVDGKRGKDPKIEILAKGDCEKQERKF